ncbi:hypothetical protein O181_004742 [Austropuccinia psidii MF-1]|uniref:Reverse transcriptase RNase H-like domain-containing protein n=1 Tax=Austropuccinia psidii MF-1 TaxID=1389203 RepID=A0A9Q3GG30_9BASI|nr:hypothetical protein [Austropuccinia psidii MF-1]
MKVVPSAYHQYLDEFSKVKAEKLPPHHACDHHIKLEGSLHPFGVIYPLSNQESDTLRAYISDNVEKGFIQPSSSSTGAPFSFVKNKDGGLNFRKIVPEELNYGIYYKELLGIFWALKHWRAFLLSLSSPFEVLTNHYSLQYLMSSKILTLCQTFWAELLSEFHFSITYHPGCLAALLDALSHWDKVSPERGEDFISNNPTNYQQIIKQDKIQASKFFAVKVDSFSNLIDSIQKAIWKDSKYRIILKDLGKEALISFSWTPWPREDSQTCQAGFPLVWHDSIYQGLCLILATMFKKQEYSSQEKLNISRELSTAYHPETDGQTERLNNILEQNPWTYVSYHHDDWKTWLPLAEFSYNKADHSSTKKSLFFTVYGGDPQFNSVHITQDTPSGKLSKRIQSVQQDFKRELEVYINRFKRYADRSRASSPVLNAGDMVWLSSKNMKSTRPTKKLSERWLGPFPILRKVRTHAYHLNGILSTQSSIFHS